MAHRELDLRERRAIEDMLNAKVPVAEIARQINRHRATVYREIKRNFFKDEELPLPCFRINSVCSRFNFGRNCYKMEN